MANKTYKCATCKDDPKGVLGLNHYVPCPDCNELPMSGPQKDRATYDLARVLEQPSPRQGAPANERVRSF